MTLVTGYPFKRIQHRKSIYLDDSLETMVQGLEEYKNGYGVGFSSFDTTKAAIGEFIERTTLFTPPLSSNSLSLPVYDYSENTVKVVPRSQVLLIEDETTPVDYYNDSSGTAVHYKTSKHVIESAFLEFFERQCLIHNWLSKSLGKAIDVERICNDQNLRHYQQAHSYFNEISVFDISLHDTIFVIFIIGKGTMFRGTGLSAHWNINSAIHHALRELFQSVVYYHPLKQISKRLKPTSDEAFYEYPESLRAAYDYLFASSCVQSYKKQISVLDNKDLHKQLVTISSSLGIRLQLCMLQSIPSVRGVKVARFLSPDTYPHLRTELYYPQNYSISKLNKSGVFPNEKKKIPFPL